MTVIKTLINHAAEGCTAYAQHKLMQAAQLWQRIAKASARGPEKLRPKNAGQAASICAVTTAIGLTVGFATQIRQINKIPMLNDEVIRLDGALRMAPK